MGSGHLVDSGGSCLIRNNKHPGVLMCEEARIVGAGWNWMRTLEPKRDYVADWLRAPIWLHSAILRLFMRRRLW